MKSRLCGRGKAGRKLVVLGMAVLAVVLLSLVVAACSSSTATTTAPPSGGTTAPSGGGAGGQVVMKNLAFDPATVTIAVGGTVTWTNEDSTTHTVTADNGEFNSGDLANGATFSFTFDTAGTFAYHCSIHPSMTGTVVVQ